MSFLENQFNIDSDHSCSLRLRPDELYQAIPGSGRLARFRRRFRNMCCVSPENPVAKSILKSNHAMKLERHRQLHFHYYIFHPFSEFRQIWEKLIVLTFALEVLIVPYVAVFLPDEHRRISKNPIMFCVFIADLIGIVDIGVACNTGYCFYESKEIVLDRHLTAMRYVKHDLVFNLLAMAPVELFAGIRYEGDPVITPFLIFSMLKAFRLSTVFVYMKRVQNAIDAKSYAAKLLRQFTALGFSVHLLACCKMLLTRVVRGDIVDLVPNSSWTKKSRFPYIHPGERYIITLYNTICALTTYSYGISPSLAPEDLMFTMLLYVLGYILYIALSAQVLLWVRNTSASKLKYQSVLNQLKEFVRYKQLPVSIKDRLLYYYEFRFQKNFYKEQEILNILSTQLRQEIILYSCRRLVTKVPFFHNIPNPLLVRIVTCLHSEIYLPQDKIVTEGEPGRSMYFIGSGTVAVYNAGGLEIAHLHDGAHFGEIVLISENSLRSATVIAIETCELFVLGREDFLSAVEPFPEVLERIRDESFKRLHARTSLKKWISHAKLPKS